MTSTSKPLIGLTCRFDENDDWYYLPADYSRAVVSAGGIPVQIPLLPEVAMDLAAELDGFVLCGSTSDVDPERYRQARRPEVKTIHRDLDETGCRLLEHAFHHKKPVLAICYGLQLLNVFLEGTLIQHIPQGVPQAIQHQDRWIRHEVAIEPGSRLAEWTRGISAVRVNSTHHQAIQKLGLGLRVAARTSDGVIEAVEGEFPDHFVVGVEWHPERIWKEEPLSRRLFSEFVLAASRRGNQLRHGAGAEIETPTAEPG
jgi:putative glutamine amidotransferase